MAIRTFVRGVSFYQDAVKQLKIGDRVQLIPEPTNEHDPNAIKIVVKEMLIGYIPRQNTEWYKRLIKYPFRVVGLGMPSGSETIGVTIECCGPPENEAASLPERQ